MMQFKKVIKTVALAALMFTGAQTSHAQDLLARQAPVDRKMKAVDTLALKNLIDREQAQMPGMDLYDDWSNKVAHQSTQLPDSFRINMRHFCMPTTSRVITSGFGARWGRQHKGLDIKVYIGDTIRAAFSGKVRIVRYEPNGYGNFIVIRHNNGLETIYGHLSKHLCRENQTVKAGDVIGLGGNTGRSTGSHLHFETRIGGIALNPALLFDFPHQDVTCDSYLFKRSSYDRANASISREDVIKASQKAAQERKAAKKQAMASTNDADQPTRDVAKVEKKTTDFSKLKDSPKPEPKKEAKKPEVKKPEVKKEAEKKVADKKVADKKVADKKAADKKAADKKAADKKAADKKVADKKVADKKAADKKATTAKKQTASAHQVKSGENLTTIAKKNGTTVDKICKLNGIKKDAVVRPGQKLRCS